MAVSSAPPGPPVHPVRFVTAASLFDGHDAAINIMRRILQRQGAEVVHLGHNRSVDEVVTAAIQEDVQGVAVSSYQGGHVEYFTYLVELLRERGAGHVKVYGGGGGVIVPREIALLHSRGVARIFSPEDGQRLGLPGMIDMMVRECDVDLAAAPPAPSTGCCTGDPPTLARTMTLAENGRLPDGARPHPARRGPGARHHRHRRVGQVVADRRAGPPLPPRPGGQAADRRARGRPDPAPRRRRAARRPDPDERASTGDRVFFRSMATRGRGGQLPERLGRRDRRAAGVAGFDLVIVETPGIGQGDAGIVPFVDRSLYVMTPEFGAASQLEKIDMLDFADAVAINKFERRGAEDALRDVAPPARAQPRRVRRRWADMPVFGTSAAAFNDDGVTALYHHLRDLLAGDGPARRRRARCPPRRPARPRRELAAVIPPPRVRYLAEIAETVRGYHAATAELAGAAPGAASTCATARRDRRRARGGRRCEAGRAGAARAGRGAARRVARGRRGLLRRRAGRHRPRPGAAHPADPRDALGQPGPAGRAAAVRPTTATLLRFLRGENLPGHFPFTAGVFAFKREGEDPARMFAGEGDAFRTNRRFHLLSEHAEAKRLSTAFDSVTLYGRDPDHAPGRLRQGRHVRRLDRDARRHEGRSTTGSTCARPTTSVSMTINGPAPTMLAYFLNTAIDQQVARFAEREGREPDRATRPPSWPRSRCATSAAPCRPTSSRRTRARTPASSPPSSPCG